jgi:hypothetical protein
MPMAADRFNARWCFIEVPGIDSWRRWNRIRLAENIIGGIEPKRI